MITIYRTHGDALVLPPPPQIVHKEEMLIYMNIIVKKMATDQGKKTKTNATAMSIPATHNIYSETA